MNGDWFTNILNMLFTFLDRIVYGLITWLYQLLLYLANLDLFGMSDPSAPGNVITEFSSRVYALLGIFMLFKVSFSILQYMVNPDDFSDKSKGFGKMVTNILVSLCLIVAVPYIFQFAFKAQGIILESNFLGHLILGETVSGTNIDDAGMSVNEEMAEDLQFLVYGSFFSVDTSVGKFDEEGNNVCASSPVLGTRAMAQNEACLNYLAEVFDDVGGENKLGDFFAAGGADSTDRRFDAFGEVVNVKTDDNKYVFKYMPVISTIAGGFVVVMLLSFCFDVAVRIIKLGFLEIIAPIPIISYMDPKQSGKDGMLGRWGSECFKTYLSLFIRLAIIYFAFFVVDVVANRLLATNSTESIYLNGDVPEGLMAVFVQVMVVLGVFMFAKEVPKLLENLIPGMQGAGNLSINPLKKINDTPIAAGALAFGGAALGSAASNSMAAVSNVWRNRHHNIENFKNKWNEKGRLSDAEGFKDKAKVIAGKAGVLGSAISPWFGIGAGAISGGVRGAASGATKKNFLLGAKEGRIGSNRARYRRDVNAEAGYSIRDRVMDRAREFAGIRNKDSGMGQQDKQIKILQNQMDNLHQQEVQVREQQMRIAGKDYDSYRKIIEKDSKTGMYRFGNYNDDGQLIGFDYEKYENWYMGELEKQSRGLSSEVEGLNSIGQSDFSNFTSYQKSIDSIERAFEDLRQEQGRLKDVSDAKEALNKKNK